VVVWSQYAQPVEPDVDHSLWFVGAAEDPDDVPPELSQPAA